MRELAVACNFGVVVLSEDFVVDEESHLDVKVRGPGGTETCWKWGDQE